MENWITVDEFDLTKDAMRDLSRATKDAERLARESINRLRRVRNETAKGYPMRRIELHPWHWQVQKLGARYGET